MNKFFKYSIFIVAIMYSLLSCVKEDESKNPYNNNPINTKSYFFSDLEKSFVLYNVGDSFKINSNNQDTLYFEVKSIVFDTLLNSENIKYEQALVRFNQVFPEYQYIKHEIGFIHITRRTGLLEYYLTLSKSFEQYADTFSTNKIIPYGIKEHFATKILNGKTYNNVYRVEEDSTLNYFGICFTIRAWISPDAGIIDITEGCGHSFLIE